MAASPTVILDSEGSANRVLVNIYLRGGADGLHLVPPVMDDGYQRGRPTLRISEKESLPLQGIFRLNQTLKPLHSYFENGEMAIIHQAGTVEDSRSHFKAEDYLHDGNVGGGWLGRFLHLTRKAHSSPLTAMSIGEHISPSLSGSGAVAMRSLDDFTLPVDSAGWQTQLQKLYTHAPGPLGKAGAQTFQALERIRKLSQQLEAEKKARTARRNVTEFADGLELIARLIKADLGLRAATIELGGWDSHFGAAALLTNLMGEFATGVANFMEKLEEDRKYVTVVVLTEFGRQVEENSSLGTDHGRGGVHWVLGGGVKGGTLHADWKELSSALLTYPVDVPVVHDYRSTLGAVCQHLMPQITPQQLFPGYEGKPLALF